MTFKTVKEIVEDLQRYYKDDDKILVYWWDRESVEYYSEDICLTPKRIDKIWEVAGSYTEGHEEYGLNSISDTVNEAISDEITQDERDHYGCIEVVIGGKTVHKPMDELPAESDEAIAEEDE